MTLTERQTDVWLRVTVVKLTVCYRRHFSSQTAAAKKKVKLKGLKVEIKDVNILIFNRDVDEWMNLN